MQTNIPWRWYLNRSAMKGEAEGTDVEGSCITLRRVGRLCVCLGGGGLRAWLLCLEKIICGHSAFSLIVGFTHSVLPHKIWTVIWFGGLDEIIGKWLQQSKDTKINPLTAFLYRQWFSFNSSQLTDNLLIKQTEIRRW